MCWQGNANMIYIFLSSFFVMFLDDAYIENKKLTCRNRREKIIHLLESSYQNVKKNLNRTYWNFRNFSKFSSDNYAQPCFFLLRNLLSPITHWQEAYPLLLTIFLFLPDQKKETMHATSKYETVNKLFNRTHFLNQIPKL
jgi:hypothetical protein